jgi:peptidoglycan/LPS O-acetylase OafA/YrhL
LDSEKNVTPPRAFAFLDILRVVGAWLVVYDHVFAVWPDASGVTPHFVKSIRTWINEPLGLIQDFGWLGVCIFFLISGFVIAHVAQRESWKNFLIKRFFRIYPLLALALLLSLLLFPPTDNTLNLGSVLANLTLVNYWINPQIVFVGVAWTLAIEVTFYLLVAVTIPLKVSGFYKVIGLLAFCAAVIYVCRHFGANFFLFAATVAFIPYLVTGYVLYLGLIKKELTGLAVLFLLSCVFATILFGLTQIHSAFIPLNNSYLISYVFAIVVFLLFYSFNQSQKVGKIISWLADTSYSVYLFHGIVCFFILHHCVPVIGYPASAALSIGSSIILVTIVHYTFEKPILNFGKRLAQRY